MTWHFNPAWVGLIWRVSFITAIRRCAEPIGWAVHVWRYRSHWLGIIVRDVRGQEPLIHSRKGRFDGGEGRSRRVRSVRAAAAARQAPAGPGGAGPAPGREAFRPPQESHGAGDRAESR